MTFDVFVMPLSRYFHGPLAAVGRSGARADALHPANRLVSYDPGAGIAPDMATALRDRLVAGDQAELPWRDEGEAVLSVQLRADAWHALRAFAADEHYPVPGFTFDGESRGHPGLDRILQGGRSAFRHLIRQREGLGFYLPADFAKPFELPLWEGDGPAPLVGSSVWLLRELTHLGRALGLSHDLGSEKWRDQFDQEDRLERVKSGWVVLRYCARVSVKQKLPIVMASAG